MDSLTSLHTFSLSARCLKVETIDSVDSLICIVKDILSDQTLSDFLVLGEGSNTVFVDDYKHTVLLNRIRGIELVERHDSFHLRVGAGENWHHLVHYCMANNIGGFENLALIPGTVGATPIQNIGAYGVEIERFIETVEFLNTHSMELESFDHPQCEFAYRDSVFKRQTNNHRIITHVNFVLPKTYTLETSYGPLQQLASGSAKDIYEHVIHIRQSKLPNVQELGNAGSFFKNPVIGQRQFDSLRKCYPTMPFYHAEHEQVKIPAAWLIDQLGFKGKQVGAIACYSKQALVLVNMGGGTGSELLSLSRQIKQQVQDHFDIELENEVRLIGYEGLVAL